MSYGKKAEGVVDVDFQKAIQNLTDILIDKDKFAEMTTNIYDAIDTDNAGTLPIPAVETFIKNFLRGNQVEGELNTDFSEKHELVFK